MKDTFTVHESELSDFANKILEILSKKETNKAKVIYLEGDLGAGKTRFTKELASLIGVNKEDVTSPTFILKKEYKTTHALFRKLIHIDAYRFNTPDEAKVLKLDRDLPDSSTLIAIEWPSRIKPIEADMGIAFTVIDDENRGVVISYEEK